MFKGIDFFSDTVTKPSTAMKQAMVAATVGDEQRGEDPTTRRLEEMTAEMLGHEAAMFLPSATMANQIAIRLLCEPGDELLAADNCHLFFAEAGGPAIHSGVMTRPISAPSGIFSPEQLRQAYRYNRGPNYPISKLMSIENTTNMGGGIAWELDALHAVLATASELGLKKHLDGSRLFNAVVKSGVTAAQLATSFDTVTVCLSKGLGCPMGAILAFSQQDYEKVRRFKQLFGGAMRQSGIIAAAGIYALQHNIERLAEDHTNATLFATRISTELPMLNVENKNPSTNMVFFEWIGSHLTTDQFNQRCIQQGIRFSQVGLNRFRAVTHLDVNRNDVESAIKILKNICD